MRRKIIISLSFLAMLAAAPATLQISKQTTFIISPLYPDGTPDYVGALNNIGSQGVTAENNAAVALLRLEISTSDQSDAKKSLEALNLPDKQNTALSWEDTTDFYKEHLSQEYADQKVSKDLLPGWNQNLPNSPAELFESAETQFAQHHPWTPDKCVMLYAYLLKIGPALDALQQASKLSKFYAPLADGESFATVIQSILAWQIDAEKFYDPLVWRATLDLGQGDIAGCEQNLLAIHRYARLVAAQPDNPLSYMTAFQIESIATSGDRVLLTDPSLTAKQALDYFKTLESLGPLPSAWQAVNIGVRIPILDVVCSFYRNASGIGSPKPIPDALSGPPFSDLAKITTGVDWNDVFHRTNQIFDVLSDYFRYPSDSDQSRQAQTAYDKLEKRAENFDPDAASSTDDKLVWGILTGLNILGKDNVVTGFHGLELYGEQIDQLSQIGLALAAYHAQHGQYPATLDALCPEYFAQVPANLFSSRPLVYTPTGDGYKLVARLDADQTEMISGMGSPELDLLTIQVPTPAQTWENDSLP